MGLVWDNPQCCVSYPTLTLISEWQSFLPTPQKGSPLPINCMNIKNALMVSSISLGLIAGIVSAATSNSVEYTAARSAAYSATTPAAAQVAHSTATGVATQAKNQVVHSVATASTRNVIRHSGNHTGVNMSNGGSGNHMR